LPPLDARARLSTKFPAPNAARLPLHLVSRWIQELREIAATVTSKGQGHDPKAGARGLLGIKSGSRVDFERA
jgi:hypothetical protein